MYIFNIPLLFLAIQSSAIVARSGKNVSTLLVTLEDNSHVLVKTEKETEEKGQNTDGKDYHYYGNNHDTDEYGEYREEFVCKRNRDCGPKAYCRKKRKICKCRKGVFGTYPNCGSAPSSPVFGPPLPQPPPFYPPPPPPPPTTRRTTTTTRRPPPPPPRPQPVYNPPRRVYWKKCFPGSSKVKLPTGESRVMSALRTGDSILTLVGGKTTATKVLGFMYKNIYGNGRYLTIHTEDGNRVSLSGTHVIFVNDYEDVLAENVNIGDSVMVEDGNNVTKSRVVNIEAGEQEGAYVPLTEHGTLLVDGVLCSSFANVPHGIAQLLAAPMRWFPSVFLSEEEGERLFVTAAKHAGYYLYKLGLLNYYHSNALQKDVETEGSLKSLEKKTLTGDTEGAPTVSSMNTCPINN